MKKMAFCFLMLFLVPSLLRAGTEDRSLLNSILDLDEHLRKAQAAQGPLCDPNTLAIAQTCLSLAREEFIEGDYWESEDILAECREKSKDIWDRILACGKDGDVDGVPDLNDQCLAAPETYNGYRDLDGCPDRLPEMAILTADRIELIEPFRFSKIYNRLHPSTKPVLLSVARILRENPTLKIRIQVYLDDSIPEEQALSASRLRAEKVKTALELLGVSPDRLDAVGKGSLDPIASNDTALGRRINQRVEFVVVRGQAAPPPAPQGETSLPADLFGEEGEDPEGLLPSPLQGPS